MTTPNSNQKYGKTKRFRLMAWSIAFIFLSAMILPLTGYIFTQPQHTVEAQVTGDNNQRSNLWRVVREGGEGYSSIPGSAANMETNVLYNTTGQNWRQIRNGLIANYGGWFLFLVVLAIIAFFALRGRVDLDEPASGKRVPRWTLFERTLHWYTAILFIVLTISGLSLLFGRAVLIPLLGPQGFSLWASFSIGVHNIVGPFFAIGPILMFFLWLKHNIPNATDIKWFAEGGGIIGKKHPSAGKANAGEKAWFWLVIIVGLGVVVYTGFALIGWVQTYFNVELTRAVAQQMHTLHAAAAILWIAVFIGHAYIGTIGSEGSIDAMTKGHVSVEWAKQHHDQWYEDVQDSVMEEAPEGESPRMAGEPTT